MDPILKEAKEILHAQGCSCVIARNGQFTVLTRRGVADLHEVLTRQPEALRDSFVADKIVGKGAAALMVLGRVKAIYADTISEPALATIAAAGISADYGRLVPNIINRTGTDICPVEKMCVDCASPEECLTLITEFLKDK